jgi:hypothetical protein
MGEIMAKKARPKPSKKAAPKRELVLMRHRPPAGQEEEYQEEEYWAWKTEHGISRVPPIESLKFVSLCDRLEQVLGALPVIESRRDTVRAEAELLCSVFNPKEAERELRAWAGRRTALLRPVTAKEAERQLLKWIRLSSELRGHISRMSKAVLDEMGLDRASAEPSGLVEKEQAARRALSVRRQQPAIRPTGRPRKGHAGRIADATASVFERLTGKPWTVPFNPETNASYGPCLDFLTHVFAACGITASPEAQARAVLIRRKHRPNETAK